MFGRAINFQICTNVYARMKIFINFAAKLARPIVSEPPPAPSRRHVVCKWWTAQWAMKEKL
jgi:hypothetical protein